MNVQNLLSAFSQNKTIQATEPSNPLDLLGSMLPSSLAGGAAVGGVMALLLGSKSTRKMAKKVAKYGGTAIVGGLAYKAYGNWQKNKALGQTHAITDQDIDHASKLYPQDILATQADDGATPLEMVLIKTMIASAKADGQIDRTEQQQLFEALAESNFTAKDKSAVFDAMAREISIQEIADSVSLDEHKAEVYLAAYLAIEVDNQKERTFLNNLAIALALPRGLTAYLEQQVDQGVAA